ncbi:50S ribosomal protein L25/general stress protein Ctc [Actinomyces polynesiensis]|uniref:50S ribosomal protein L25/general stress protein Ctc n=1 Tax=Actinomyces polynesiensis TaxID=1325934 RepID=UPI0005BDEA76|nr:50S ribosomal protein L25/general stress protein Ctc [Actinomyces polynesiensis]
MSTEILSATVRTEFGKGAARRARRAGLVPVVVYGHEGEPVHLDLPAHELFLIVRSNKNAVVTLKTADAEQLALVKDIQRHPVSRAILHVDLLAIKAGEKVQVTVPLVVVGEPTPGTVHNVEEFEIPVKAPVTAIPEGIEVDITGLEIGAVIRVSDLPVPEGVEIELDPEQDILSIQEVQEEPEEPAETTEPAEGEAPAGDEAATEAE